MIRDFTKDELEAAERGQDTELTLGASTLFILGCGLLLLCTLCFSIGYFVGRRNSQISASTALPSSGSKPLPVPTGSGSKPGAAGQQAARPQAAATGDVSTDPGSGGPPIQAQAALVAVNPGASQSQVKPALDSQVHPALVAQAGGAQSSSALQVQPAMTQVQGWMVQIAAVSRSEDAEVLVSALRKRGYTVTARRQVGDNLIHVQTGPFVNRNDANTMRQKLLNDGYNAIVQ
jgi:cell division septation protein DedD